MTTVHAAWIGQADYYTKQADELTARAEAARDLAAFCEQKAKELEAKE
ncbi:hypothetical protein ACUIAJ_03980 [Dermabacteraceae bacterium CCM 9519]